MAARKPKTAPAEPVEGELAEQEEELVEYGPYELVDDVNSLSFGADPVVELVAGEQFLTTDLPVAMFLDECPHVRKAGK